jgi:sec-independent protein translocase protein TatA
VSGRALPVNSPVSVPSVRGKLIAMPQGAEGLTTLAIVVLVFGAAKLPELARGTGQALRIFKTEPKGLQDVGGRRSRQPRSASS